MCRQVLVAVFSIQWLLSGVSIAAAQGNALADYGIVLLHGKGGQPGGNLESVADALRNEGAHVVMPRMAWSGSKGEANAYLETYTQSLSQIDSAIEQLKAQGAKKIVVAGVGSGGLVALTVAALETDRVAGCIVANMPATYLTDVAYGEIFRLGVVAPGMFRAGDIPHPGVSEPGIGSVDATGRRTNFKWRD